MTISVGEQVWYLYLLECRDGSYYTGITTNVERRFAEHLAGKGARYTRSHPPLRVLESCAMRSRSIATRAEWEIKRLPKESKLAAVKALAIAHS